MRDLRALRRTRSAPRAAAMFAPPGPARPPPPSSIASPAEEGVPRPCVRPRPSTRLAPHPRGAAPRGRATRPGTSGSSRCGARLDGGHAGDRGAGREPRRGSQALRARARACTDAVLGPGAPSSSSPPAGRARRDADTPRGAACGARRASLQSPPHVRAVRHRRRATGSRTPPRWPSPRCPGSPTTRCSSAGRPASARPTCCTRSPTTSAARRRAHGPLHHRRGVHRPASSARCTPARSRRSRPPIATSTCCSSTTSSSSQSKAAPSRSSSTPSTRCTAPARSSS